MKIRSRALWREVCLWSVAAAMAIVPVVSMPAGTPAASTGEQRWVTQGRLKIPQSNGLVAVDFADSSTGIAVGIKGTVLRTVNAGEDWSPLPLPANVAGTDVTFTDVAFAGPHRAYIVGFSSIEAAKTPRIFVVDEDKNGQFSWSEQSLVCIPEECEIDGLGYLAGISFSDCSTGGSCYGHAVGGSEDGTGFILNLLETADDEEDYWFVRTRPNPDDDVLFPPLLDVSFTDRAGGGGCDNDNHCFGHVVGRAGTIYATSDGGSTWTPQCGFNSLAISDTGCGDLSSDLLETDFTGVSFSGDPDCPECGHVVAGCTVFFGILGSGNYPTDTNRTCSAADSSILATKDGGETWDVQDFPVDARAQGDATGKGFRLESVHFLDKDHGYVVGGNPRLLGYIAKTTNGGEDWVQVESGIPKVFTDVAFSDANTGHVVGQVAEVSDQPGVEESTAAGGHILKTADAGDSWELRVGDDFALLTGATFADPAHGWVVGTLGRILGTSDGGLTWKRQQSTLTAEQLNAVSCASSTDCVAVGNQGAHPDTIVLTNDGGATWSRGRSGLPVSLSGVAYPGPQRVFAVGCSGSNCAGGGVILRSEDAGRTWISQFVCAASPCGPANAQPFEMLNAISCFDENRCRAVGVEGTIVATDDGGRGWTKSHPAGSDINLEGISCPSAVKCVAAGSTGHLLSSNGQSWSVLKNGGSNLNGVSCVSDSVCRAVGESGTILSTDDGGEEWTAEATDLVSGKKLVAVALAGSPVRSWAFSEDFFVFSTYHPPGPVLDLAAIRLSPTSARLEWLAPGDDGPGKGGPARLYQIRRSPDPITEQTFDSADHLCDGDCGFAGVGAIGDPVSFHAAGLEEGVGYNFAVRAMDASGYTGPISTATIVGSGVSGPVRGLIDVVPDALPLPAALGEAPRPASGLVPRTRRAGSAVKSASGNSAPAPQAAAIVLPATPPRLDQKAAIPPAGRKNPSQRFLPVDHEDGIPRWLIAGFGLSGALNLAFVGWFLYQRYRPLRESSRGHPELPHWARK